MSIWYQEENARFDKPTKKFLIEMEVVANNIEDVNDWLIRQLMEERGNVEDMCWDIAEI